MFNPDLDRLRHYPFQRLRDLLGDTPPGGEAIDLSIGEPKHGLPDFLAGEVVANAALFGKYPPAAGSAALRRAIAAWLGRRYGLEDKIDADRHVCALNGTREGLYMLGQVVRRTGGREGEAVMLMPNPFYQCYLAAAVMNGARPVTLAATAENGFLPDPDALDDDLLQACELFYLCSPANPQGAVAGRDYLARLIALARRYDFLLAADECYAEIYDRDPPPGVLDVAAETGSFENVVAFHSLSKRSSAPGLRSGFIAGDERVIARMIRLRSYGGAPLPGPLDAASARAWEDEDHVRANRERYRRNIDIAEECLGGRFGFYRPQGGFFLWLDVGDGEAACRRLWREAGVKTLPGRYLCLDDAQGGNAAAAYLRVALVHDGETTRRGLARLAAVLDAPVAERRMERMQ